VDPVGWNVPALDGDPGAVTELERRLLCKRNGVGLEACFGDVAGAVQGAQTVSVPATMAWNIPKIQPLQYGRVHHVEVQQLQVGVR
jgi:hypothetical protein